jgi:hypothetical protein
MRKISWLHFISIFMVTVAVSAQNLWYILDSKDFNKAVALFKDDQYASAQIIFNKVKETATEELKSVVHIPPIVPFEPINPMQMSWWSNLFRNILQVSNKSGIHWGGAFSF